MIICTDFRMGRDIWGDTNIAFVWFQIIIEATV